MSNGFLSPTMFCRGVALLLMSIAFICPLTAQDAVQTPVANASVLQKGLDQLKQKLTEQESAVEEGTDAMAAEQKVRESVEAWMKLNDWESLTINDQVWLCKELSSPDQINKKAFSVRWTGTLRAPATGYYRFSAFNAPGAEGTMKLWLAKQLVMDTSQGGMIKTLSTDSAEKSASNGVLLTAGEAVELQVDYIREPLATMPGVFRISGYPAAVLLWESDVMERQVIPSTAFALPSAFSKTEQQGLRGEYYSDATMTTKAATRLDSAVDFIWDAGPVCTKYREIQQEIIKSGLAKIVGPEFLAGIKGTDADDFVQNRLPVLFPLMTASERLSLVTAIADEPEILKRITFTQMTGILRWFALSADKSVPVDILVRWSEAAEPPVTQPGFYPGRGEGGYLSANIRPYFQLCRQFLATNPEENIEQLVAHLENEDGTCNLTVTYILCCVCRMSQQSQVIMDALDEHIYNENLDDQKKVSWLIAEAYKLETVFDYDFKPGNGLFSLEKAMKIAKTPELRLQVIREMAARLISLDRVEEAKSLIVSVQDQYKSAAQQTALDTLYEAADTIAAKIDVIRAERDTLPEAIGLYAKELEERAAAAEQLGDSYSAERYRKEIAAYEQNQSTVSDTEDIKEEK